MESDEGAGHHVLPERGLLVVLCCSSASLDKSTTDEDHLLRASNHVILDMSTFGTLVADGAAAPSANDQWRWTDNQQPPPSSSTLSMSAPSPASSVSVPLSGRLLLPAVCDPPTDSHPAKPATWVIFGATGHMGRSLARAALAHGDRVAAVGQRGENTLAEIANWHEQCLGLLCDVRVRETVGAVFTEAIAHWGQIDVVVNCTGYGVVAAAEDQTEYDLMNQFNTNFIGTLNIIQLSLPYFRKNLIAGRYLIFSSTAGALGVPGLSGYCSSKYAVEALVESMLYEMHSFNIKATLVEPGYVRRDDDDDNDGRTPAGSTIASLAQPIKRYSHFAIHPRPSAPYASPESPAGHAKRIFQWLGQRQPTSAVRSAELVWQLAHCSYPPLRLLLGSYAVESIRDRLRSVIEEIEDWKHLSFPADEDDDDGPHADDDFVEDADGRGDEHGKDHGEGDEDERGGSEDLHDEDIMMPDVDAVSS